MRNVYEIMDFLKEKEAIHTNCREKAFELGNTTHSLYHSTKAVAFQSVIDYIEDGIEIKCSLCDGITEWIQYLDGSHPAEKFNFCPRCGRKL